MAKLEDALRRCASTRVTFEATEAGRSRGNGILLGGRTVMSHSSLTPECKIISSENKHRVDAAPGVTRRTLFAHLAGGGLASALMSGGTAALAAEGKPNRKLLLGGGGIRGAYQAGAISRLLSMGFQPNVIYGVSVGGLNAAFLGDRAFFLGKTKGEYFSKLGQPLPPRIDRASLVDWPFLGQQLVAFWRRHITSDRSLVRKKRTTAISLLFRSFNGVFDISPLRALVKANLDPGRLKASIPVGVAAVNIDNGETEYHFQSEPDFLEAVIASAAVPLAMPIVELTRNGVKKRYCDGGIRETLPTGLALKDVQGKRPTHLMCIACQPDRSRYPALKNTGNFISLLHRYSDIAADEIIKNDVAVLKQTEDQHKIPYIVIRPTRTLNWDPKTNSTFDIDHFSSEQISQLLDEGAFSANKILADPANGFVERGFVST